MGIDPGPPPTCTTVSWAQQSLRRYGEVHVDVSFIDMSIDMYNYCLYCYVDVCPYLSGTITTVCIHLILEYRLYVLFVYCMTIISL